MSEGTFGLSRRKCTLSNWRAMTCWMRPLAALSWQPAGAAAWTGAAGRLTPTGASASAAATTARPSVEIPCVIGFPPLKLRGGQPGGRPPHCLRLGTGHLVQEALSPVDQCQRLLLVDRLVRESRRRQHVPHLGDDRVAAICQQDQLVLEVGVILVTGGVAFDGRGRHGQRGLAKRA